MKKLKQEAALSITMFMFTINISEEVCVLCYKDCYEKKIR